MSALRMVEIVSVGQSWMEPLIGESGIVEKKRENRSGIAVLVRLGGFPDEVSRFWFRAKDVATIAETEKASA